MSRAPWSLPVLALLALGCAIDWTVPQPPAGDGGAGGGGAGRGGDGSTSSQEASSSASTGSGTTQCDGAGQCLACIDCATNGPCLEQLGQCMKSRPCQAVLQCATGCGDPQSEPTCVQQCVEQQPDAKRQLTPLLDCLCATCPKDCNDGTDMCTLP